MKKKIVMISLLLSFYSYGMDCEQFNKKHWPKKITSLVVKRCKELNTVMRRRFVPMQKGLKELKKNSDRLKVRNQELQREIAYQKFMNGER